MPRVSRPYEPASERKHGECAVSLTGSASASRMLSRTVFVSEISEVEIRYCVTVFSSPPFSTRNMSSANFGNWPVPYRISGFTMYGVYASV